MDISKHLLELSDRLDKEGKMKCADAVDGLIKEASLQKVAQYVGAIGYVLKQNRAIANCIRKKRVASNGPMQEVVLDCLKEYQDGQEYYDTEWTSKYAACVKKEPNLFENSHVKFLAVLGSENKIDEHLNNVRKVAALLAEQDQEDDFIEKILSHAETLGDVLKQESDQQSFKFAAPRLPSRRNRWQQILNPTQVTKNPLSWFRRRRERGEDEETLAELAIVADEIHEITMIAQKMSTAIFRLKNQVGSYLTELQDDPDLSNRLRDLINNLNPNDWNTTIRAIHQLQWQLNNLHIDEPYNQSIFDQAAFLAQDLTENIDLIYEKLDRIQDAMSTLGRRTPVLGTDPGSGYSAVEEFGVLERILDKIYRNPFDNEAHYEAKRAHARLDRKLRYMDVPTDASQTEISSPTPENASETRSTPEGPVENLDQERVDRIANELSNTLSQNNISVDDFKNALDVVLMGAGSETPISDTGRRYLDAVLSQLQSGRANNQASTSDNPQAEVLGDENEYFPETNKPQSGKDTSQPIDLSSWQTPKASNNVDLWIKIANEIDHYDQQIADLIDQYIENHILEKDEINYPQFSSIIKEKEGVSKK